MKLTPGINTGYELSYEKCACKMLMKLTPGIKYRIEKYLLLVVKLAFYHLWTCVSTAHSNSSLRKGKPNDRKSLSVVEKNATFQKKLVLVSKLFDISREIKIRYKLV